MVRSRLKLLLAEHNVQRLKQGQEPLTVKQLAEEAGLAESTITGLTAHRAKMVSFDTINALCAYFSVQPGDLFEYIQTPESS